MNAIEQIACHLGGPARAAGRKKLSRTAVWQPAQKMAPVARQAQPSNRHTGLIDEIRDYLRANGPTCAAVLADATSCTASIVSAALAHDRKIGRVETFTEAGGRLVYSLRDGDAAVFRMISRLQALGYKVSEP